MTPDRVDECPDPKRPGHWVLPHWDEDGVRAGVTDIRHDLRLREGPAPAAVAAFEELRRTVSGMTAVVVSPQVHGTSILVHQGPQTPVTVAGEADGHLTCTPGILLVVTVADCVPVYLRHAPSGWLGLLHAGWRGTAEGVLGAALAGLADRGLSLPDVIMHCGVSICGSCYEVGPEVHEAVGFPLPASPAPLDLRAVLAAQGAAAGLRDVTVSGLCTLERAAFHSHRGSRGGPGRMAAYLGQPSP